MKNLSKHELNKLGQALGYAVIYANTEEETAEFAMLKVKVEGEIIRQNESPKSKEQIVKKWIEDMIQNGFMSGWGGDRSGEFKKSQFDSMMKVLDGDVEEIGGNPRLLATIYSDWCNLQQYCGWSESELTALLALFGFKNIQEVLAISGVDAKETNLYMEKGKLKKGVEFRLTAIDFNR